MSSPSCLFRLSPIAAAMLAVHAMPSSADSAADVAATTTLSAIKVEDSAASDIKADQVASPKFTQPLVDTPQTISVLKKELLIQQGALSLSDALRQTPGITFQQGENGNSTSGDAVFLRGFDTQGSIFLDNIRDISPAVRDLFNIEQVEIVKGPAGADNGRGVAAGYINLVSKTPFADDLATGSFSYGTRDRRRAMAARRSKAPRSPPATRTGPDPRRCRIARHAARRRCPTVRGRYRRRTCVAWHR